MTIKSRTVQGAAVLALLAAPLAAYAHKAWLLPSQTVLSQKGFITVDAAVSNDLFYFNHNPLRVDDLVVTAPDGTVVQAQNPGRGKFRNTFDLDLQQEGTYRIATGGANTARRIETFVTVGKPSSNLKASGVGLELVPVTHPNDLYAGETATFQFLLDGKPAAGVEMEVIAGGSRYRDSQGEMKLKTDATGKVQIKWPVAGMYWMEAIAPKSTAAGGARTASYIGTFEVLTQ